MNNNNNNNNITNQSSSDFSDSIDNNDPLIVSLKMFMSQYELSSNDKKNIDNIISTDRQYKKKFYVPNTAISQLMDILNKCYINRKILHFLEMLPQDDSYEIGSGLSFDFTFITTESKIDFEDVVGGFLEILFKKFLLKILLMTKDDKYIHHCILLGSPISEYIDSLFKYKNSFRIIIPGIQINHLVKKFLYDRLWNCPDIRELFLKKTKSSFRSVFHKSSYSIPSCLIGSCLYKDKFYLDLISVYKVCIEKGITFDGISMVSNPSNIFSNLVYECSLNYEKPQSEGGIITKRVYMPRSSIIQKMKELLEEPKEQLNIAYDKALIEINMYSIYDEIFDQFKKILNMISDERLNDVESRNSIISALAADNNGKYKCIALWLVYNRCKDISLEEFNEIWNSVVNNTNIVQNNLKSLRYWANLDSPSQMYRFVENEIRQMLLRDVKCVITQGSIGHTNIANYLEFMFKNTYMTSINNKTITWYEFITPNNNKNIERGQLYKWKNVGSYPVNLSEYISSDLVDIIKKVLYELIYEINFEKNEDRIKYLKNLKSKYIGSMKQIFNTPFKKNIIEATADKFVNDTFIKNMDKTKNILGVGNGVLEFNKGDVKLLDHYHTYPISMYTETDYIPYDPENKYIKTVYKLLYSLFPEDEMDALDFILYYFSTSLDWFPKESLFLILEGSGCHSINTKILMYDKSIKMIQDIIVGDQIMGDDYTPRNVLTLFRGRDSMVKITLNTGHSFIVNQNHILSIKFNELSKIKFKNDLYYTIWYEYHFNRSIKKCIKCHSSMLAASKHLDFIKETKINNIVKKNDIIDIKVCDLYKYPKYWLLKNYVNLYKPNDDTLYGFDMEYTDIDDYYGFELDNNHRYLTEDLIVHHNSNGKSVLIEFFRETLGESYARRMPLSFITGQSRTKSAAADPSMMEMKFARFVNYSESERNEKANIATIKELTGGDSMSARQLYKEQENFKPNCNHLLATNHHLRIESNEYAVWRRFIIYKMKKIFKENPNPDCKYEAKKDTNFINKIKNDKRYRSAFLAILVHYRKNLYDNYDGQILRVPHPTIKKETNIYRQQEDIYERFIVNRVFYKENKSDQSMDEFLTIFRNYYRNENGERLKIKNDELKYLFTNSSIQQFIKVDTSGMYILKNIYTVDEAAPIIPGSILLKEYLKK